MTELIKHPERFDRDTLYELRSTLALHPYAQTVRLLLLHNLFLLHDPSFDEELRRASLYITDRRAVFNIVEAAHYRLANTDDMTSGQQATPATVGSRTVDLIDSFLGTMPDNEEENGKKRRRRPTPADAATDYVAYLLATEDEWDEDADVDAGQPQMKGQDLIDQFLQQERPRIVLGELADTGETLAVADAEEPAEEEYFTETLARIYIRQGRYQKALDIIRRLADSLPQKNAYFADQIRFLEKLIINSNNKK